MEPSGTIDPLPRKIEISNRRGRVIFASLSLNAFISEKVSIFLHRVGKHVTMQLILVSCCTHDFTVSVFYTFFPLAAEPVLAGLILPLSFSFFLKKSQSLLLPLEVQTKNPPVLLPSFFICTFRPPQFFLDTLFCPLHIQGASSSCWRRNGAKKQLCDNSSHPGCHSLVKRKYHTFRGPLTAAERSLGSRGGLLLLRRYLVLQYR